MVFDYKMIIVTRKDLKLSTGKLAAQIAHAAVECALQTKKKKPIWFKKWMMEGGKKAIVSVEKVDDFKSLKKNSNHFKIISTIIKDAGHTEIPPGTQTVLGIGPAPSNIIDQITGDLPLL